MEKYTTSLEPSIRLKKAGFKQKSKFYWKCNEIQEVVSERQMKEWIEKHLPSCNKYYSAFLTDELLNVLVHSIKYKGEYHWLSIDKGVTQYHVAYLPNGEIAEECIPIQIHNEKLPDALAELWLWLNENDYLNFKK